MTCLSEFLDLVPRLADDRPRLALVDEEADLEVPPGTGASLPTFLHNTAQAVSIRVIMWRWNADPCTVGQYGYQTSMGQCFFAPSTN